MSGYVPNNRNVRAAAEPAPYNGNFDQQASRPLEGLAQVKPDCLVGMRFIWDNGEALPANIPYRLTSNRGTCIQSGLDARGSFTQTLPHCHYEAQLLATADVDSAVASARTEVQSALDEILAAERTEAEQLSKEQAGRSELSNHFHTAYAFGKGFFLGAFGMLKSAKEMHDLASPYNFTWNLLASAWKTKAGPGETWAASYLRNFAQEQHEDLVEALGYDPASFTREQLAAAYEIACFIYDDGPSQQILERFAVDYAKAQNVEEVAEFGGGGVFELVLIAVLAVFTGGIAAVARGATALRHAASLKRLGAALQRLSLALKNAKIKLKGHAQGSGTSAQTVEVPRPDAVKAEKLDAPNKNLPGPAVPTYHLDNYADGMAFNRQVSGDEIFYKYHGKNNRLGKTHNYVTKKQYANELELRNDLAILDEWGIEIDRITTFKPPKGTWISEGVAAKQVGEFTDEFRPGGGYQGLIDINNLPKSSWIRTDKLPKGFKQ